MGFHLSVIETRRPGSANSPPPSWSLYFLYSPRSDLSLGVQNMGFHLNVIEIRRPGSANSPPPSWFLYFLFSPRNTLSLGVQYMGFHLSVIETRRPGTANSPPPSWSLCSPRRTGQYSLDVQGQDMGFCPSIIEPHCQVYSKQYSKTARTSVSTYIMITAI